MWFFCSRPVSEGLRQKLLPNVRVLQNLGAKTSVSAGLAVGGDCGL